MIVIEGTDGVGKTTTINALNMQNIQDRDKYISELIDTNITLADRSNKIYEYLKDKDEIVIFMVNNNKQELEERINKRGIVDEYDKLAYLYNLIYLETYEYMEKNRLLNNKVYLADVTSLCFKEQIKVIYDIINKVI